METNKEFRHRLWDKRAKRRLQEELERERPKQFVPPIPISHTSNDVVIGGGWCRHLFTNRGKVQSPIIAISPITPPDEKVSISVIHTSSSKPTTEYGLPASVTSGVHLLPGAEMDVSSGDMFSVSVKGTNSEVVIGSVTLAFELVPLKQVVRNIEEES